MKIKLYSIAILATCLIYGCHNNNGHLSLKTIDTSTSFKYEADFDETKTTELISYLDSTLNIKLPKDQKINLPVNLNDNEKFNLEVKKGWLEINFDKRNSTGAGYLKLRTLTEGIQKKLSGH